MAFLRAKVCSVMGGSHGGRGGCAQGLGPHSDQERILEEAVYKHVQFFWEAVNSIAATKN